MAILWENIPQYLIELPHWVVWKYETRQGKRTKVPYNAMTGRKAMSNLKSTWSAFEVARAAYEAGNADGVGFMMDEALGLVGIDFDKCIAKDGTVDDEAAARVEAMATYTEVTPSGTGLRMFAFGVLPPEGRKKGNVEMYQAVRFLTITGAHVPESSREIEHRPAQILALHESVFGSKTAPSPPPAANTQFDGDDGELIKRMLASANGADAGRLYAGDWSEYSSQSEGDSALCYHLAFWCGRDVARVDRLFRASGLMRPKWDERHGADGTTYGQMTVSRACDKVRESYTAPAPQVRMRGAGARAYVNNGENAEPVEEEAGNLADDDIPIPYAIENGRLVFVIEKTNRQGETVTSANYICDFAAYIAEEISVEGGDPSYKIALRTPGTKGRLHYVDVPAKVFADGKQLAAVLSTAAGAHHGIRAGMEKHLPPALKLLTEDFGRGYRFTRTGWWQHQDRDVFLIPGREPENVSIQLPRKLSYSTVRDADVTLGQEALEHLIKAQKMTASTVVVSFMFGAPLSRLMDWDNERYAMHVAGRSGSLKSTCVQLFMCLYGPSFIEDNLLLKWGEGATPKSVIGYATHAGYLPLLIDNYKPQTGYGSSQFVGMIHNVLEGSDRDRLDRDGNLRNPKAINTWPISTGEDVAHDDAAALARIEVVQFAREKDPGAQVAQIQHVSEAQRLSPHLCALSNAWFDTLESPEMKEAIPGLRFDWEQARAEWSALLRTKHPEMVNPLRVASNLATNQITWKAMALCPALERISKAYTPVHMVGLRELATSMAVHTTQALEAARFLTAIQELLSSGRCCLTERSKPIPQDRESRVIGWYADDNSGAYLFPKTALEAVLKLLGVGGLNNISDHTLYDQLDEMGAKGAGTGDKPTKVVKNYEGKAVRVLHVLEHALEADGGSK